MLPGMDLRRSLENVLFADFAEKCVAVGKVRRLVIDKTYWRIEEETVAESRTKLKGLCAFHDLEMIACVLDSGVFAEFCG